MLRSLESESESAPPSVRCSHPSAAQLERFMRGELSPPEVRPIVHHMIGGCPECLRVTRPLWRLMEEKPKRPGGRS